MDNRTPSQIECPNCGEAINVTEVLSHQLADKLKAEYEAKARKQRETLEKERADIKREQQKLSEALEKQSKLVDEKVHEQVKRKETELRDSIKKQLGDEQSEQFKVMQAELNDKSHQLKEFNKAKGEIERLKREKDEMQESLQAEAERKLNKQLRLEKEKIQKSEAEKAELKLSEKQHLIEQLNSKLEEAQRQVAQGSMQVQGEVQETAIEAWLSKEFPLDGVDEIKKGERGADCLQTVHTRSQQNCGTIYYESKRTKNFSQGWIEKFKADIREKGADIGVLVTEAMPAEMERMGLVEGIWICNYAEFKGLCHVLRDSLIKIKQVLSIQDNKGDKMSMLYDFLTGNEFRMQVEAIVEGFTQMNDDLVKEKRAMASIWKKREKQIEKVLLNTSNMYSSVQGIAGSAVKSLPLLELPEGDDDANI